MTRHAKDDRVIVRTDLGDEPGTVVAVIADGESYRVRFDDGTTSAWAARAVRSESAAPCCDHCATTTAALGELHAVVALFLAEVAGVGRRAPYAIERPGELGILAGRASDLFDRLRTSEVSR